MHNTQEVLKAAQTAQEGRLKSQPVWVRELVADLVLRLTYEARRASDAEGLADSAVQEANTLLSRGPADSDTFVSIPRELSVHEDGDEANERPLGRGVCVEFRREGLLPGEGFSVRLRDGALEVSNCGPLAVLLPSHPSAVRIEAR